jgi:hypothetical protein
MKIEPIYNRRDNYSRYRVDGVEDVTKTRRTKLCAVTNEMYEVVVDIKSAWNWMSNGRLIQDAMPNLTLEQREFLISGLTPAEFKELYRYEEE